MPIGHRRGQNSKTRDLRLGSASPEKSSRSRCQRESVAHADDRTREAHLPALVGLTKLTARMLDPASAKTWLGVGGAALGVAAGLIKLITEIRRARRGHGPSPSGAPPPTHPPAADSAMAADLVPEPLTDPDFPVGPRFIDRKTEINELIARVQAGDDNVLKIEGPQWIGKSATAARLFDTLRRGTPGGSFDPRGRDFVWFDADGDCPTLAKLCGLLSLETEDQALSTASETERRELLRAHLARNRTVLAIDNLSLSDDGPSQEMVSLLERLPNGSLVIASVNRPGELISARVELEDLTEEDARTLIADRAKRFDLDGLEQFDATFTKRLYQLVGGNPGVIEWFLRGYHETAEPLEQRVAAVEGGDELADIFGPAWQRLNEDCQATLRVCAYLRGEATQRQMEIAAGRSAEAMRTATEVLRREMLLKPVRSRNRPTGFTCDRAFRQFVGASQTPAELRSLFTRRLADHYIDHFTANPEDAEYGASEIAAWRTLWGELRDEGDDERMQALFRSVLDILFTLGQFDELIGAAELCHGSAAEAENLPAAALAAAMKAGTLAIRGEEKAAESSLANAVDAAEKSGDAGAISRAMRCRGFLHYRARRPRQALAAINGSEQLSREGGDGVNLVDTLDLRTAANWYLRRFDACEAAANASLNAGAEMEWQRARAYPLRYLAELATQRRQPAEARKLIDEAEEIATRYADKRQRARVDLTRARLCLLEGELDEGKPAAQRALSEATRLGLPAEREEAAAMTRAISRARRSRLWRHYYALRRPSRLTRAPVGGD